MSNPLPEFRYHPDPMATGVLTQTSQSCECCGQARGVQYTGPIYAVEDIGVLCPWCIADGSAARRFDAEFTAVDYVLHHHMRADGDLTGYLFRCLRCRTELACADAS